MKFDLTVDQGPCQTDLRTWCLGYAAFTLLFFVLGSILNPSTLSFVGLALTIGCNVCLILGCKRESYILVGIWLIYGFLMIIGYPLAWIFGGTSEGFIVATIVFIVMFALHLYCTRIVFSYFLLLKNREARPQSVPVV
ncbi:uncharacterized protein LOC117785529 [Drosophila innubila]|uniref:uncharacterized protein LOC117785529 n=1 Tax=Drosophila innubila TaxID=198719 RepID=UPI00148C877C|nr:uncharacterized protein LOC117785529 [Drosophila innubila]